MQAQEQEEKVGKKRKGRPDRGPRARQWCFTSFKRTAPAFVPEKMKYLVYQQEKCPLTGKLHYQGYVNLKNQSFMTGVKAALDDLAAHLEVARGSLFQNKAYCSKDNTRVGETHEFGKFVAERQRTDLDVLNSSIAEGKSYEELCEEHFSTVAKYSRFVKERVMARQEIMFLAKDRAKYKDQEEQQWQGQLIDMVATEVPDPRKVVWVVDPVGGQGKSWLGSYLQLFHNAVCFEPGKKQDMAYIWRNQKSDVVVFDIPRTLEKKNEDGYDPLSTVFSFIECLKNGRMINSKYESVSFRFPVPHVIVFSNFAPDKTCLSEDRWDLRYLLDGIFYTDHMGLDKWEPFEEEKCSESQPADNGDNFVKKSGGEKVSAAVIEHQEKQMAAYDAKMNSLKGL